MAGADGPQPLGPDITISVREVNSRPGPSEPEFRKVLRGWDPEDVRTHLGIVASEIRDT